MTDPIGLTLGCTFSDRVEALVDGRVSPPGVELEVCFVEAQALFNQTLKEHRFDVAELSMGSHIAAVAAGRDHYVALPVFLSRSFRHSNLYVRSDRGIGSPGDLAGRTIGLIDFQQTAALWLRGMLADEHGVDARSIRWVTGGLHAPVLTDRMPGRTPDDVDVTRTAATLDDLLAAGDLDAVISPTVPRSFRAGIDPVARLWPDYRAAEADYWRRTGVFPIMHVVVVRRELVQAHPELPGALYDAFAQALALARRDASERDFPKLSLPWLIGLGEDSRDTFGPDLWTYGIDANRAVVETMLRYARRDGLCRGDVTLERLFPSRLPAQASAKGA